VVERVVARHASYEDDFVEGDSDYDADEDLPVDRVYHAEPVRTAVRVNRAERTPIAYVTAMRRADPAPRPQPPRAEEAYDFDEAEPPRRAAMPELEDHGAKPMVTGSRAVLRNGIAYAPSQAPESVKNAIWAANTLRRKPYVWGGGHGSFYDGGYDCSGTVSFALHGAGALSSPLPSSEFMSYGERGRGRWITVYSRRGHTFAVIAGLRLDTTDFQNGGNSGPRWHEDARDTRGYVARHPAGM
jgi:cell wall-associated NlpC family hydrolase